MIIYIRDLVKRYGDNIALDHLDLDVEKGQILGLLGPNGCGKTTLISTILGLLNYDKGEIKVFGEELNPDSYELKRKIGIVPQEIAVYWRLTVRENIEYFCSLYIKDNNKVKKYVEEALEFVRLKKYEDKLPNELSGGLRRRLNIACGISHKPELVFLDEPTVAVDAQSRNFILDGIRHMNRQGSTIVYTTHYLEEAEQICDEMVIMDKGRAIAKGNADELKSMISIKEKIIISLIHKDIDLIDEMKQIKNIFDVEKIDNDYILSFEDGKNNLYNLIDFINDKGLIYKKLYTKQTSLNDVFLELTGRELRD